ncbi:MAG: hemolysin family protein [Hyphomicrobiaceae bacterium]
MVSEAPSSASDDRKSAGDGSSGATTPASWLGLLKSRLGLPGGQTLRDTIEAALHVDEAGSESFSAEERAMLLRLLRYGKLRIEDVMVPRADIVAIDESETVGRALQLLVEAGVSRLPMYHDTLDDPRGMVHVKDLVQSLVALNKPRTAKSGPTKTPQEPRETEANGSASSTPAAYGSEPGSVIAVIGADTDVELKSDVGLKSEHHSSDARSPSVNLRASEEVLSMPLSSARVRRPVLFVPRSMPAMNLLIRMQSTRTHMALVVDEYGGTDGLVTIEDLVEEIVGEIEDEHDEMEVEHITVDASSGMIASARTPVDDLEKRLGVELMPDDDPDIDTLGGLVFSLVGRVPARGELVSHPAGVEFEVLDADPRRIKKLKVHIANGDIDEKALLKRPPAATG